jgi:hypothetical protein
MRHGLAIVPLALLVLGGCGGATPPASSPLGRSLGAERMPVRAAPAPSGDPPAERSGTVPASQTAMQNAPTAGSISATPQIALRRYALAYTNWTARSLPATERRLASLAIGPARLTAEQLAASTSATVELAANHVQNKGVVLAIAPGLGPAVSQWVVVTQEQTAGTGPYAGLPPTLHVTLARTERLDGGWVISSWTPRT